MRAIAVPQQEEPVAPPPVQPEPTAPPAPLPINFGNPIAVRVAFLMSLGILMTAFVPLVNLLIVVWCLLAGWAGVRLYRRLTGLRLTVAAGARLGFLTGILATVSLTIVFAMGMLFSSQEIIDEFAAQMAKQSSPLSEVAKNPSAVGTVLVMSMFLMFVLMVGICAAGGALGAKFSPPAEPRA
ncbi:MAG TPA: hypothetical protein VFT60_05585 [Bryobacteraceae bacterium]|nr:hypothetical protein [Bryobacteraceae bacterium]